MDNNEAWQKLEEYGGAEEAYSELAAIHELFDDESGNPYEGDESLSQLVAGVMRQLESLRKRNEILTQAVRGIQS